MSHSKRSETFLRQIESLATRLRELPVGGEDRATVNSAIEILLNNTTDTACVVKARQHEPIFPLRGQDATSAEFVEGWARKFRTWIANATLTQEQEAKAMAKWRDAMECAAEMRAWPTARNPD